MINSFNIKRSKKLQDDIHGKFKKEFSKQKVINKKQNQIMVRLFLSNVCFQESSV